MKTGFRIIISLCVVLLLAGIASALKCYRCKSNDPEKCKDPIEQGKETDQLDQLDCTEPNASKSNKTTEDAAPADPAAPPPDSLQLQNLLEREEASSEAPPSLDSDIESGLGCIKLVYTKDGKEGVVRGCGADGCTVTKAVMALPNGTCHFCKDDLCNSSVRTQPIEWAILLVVVAIFAAFEHY